MSAAAPGASAGSAPGRTVVFVGGGPRTVSLLERMAANAAALGSGPLSIHLVDPHPPGGRIWRRRQSKLLWMNSMARDVTMFTDASVACAGPIVPGPSLDEWVHGAGRQVLIDAGLRHEADTLQSDSFASREVQSLYLGWAFDRSVAALPVGSVLRRHPHRAVRLVDVGARQRVTLADGTILDADVVVLAQGYLDRRMAPDEQALDRAAAATGLTYLPPDFTADLDLSGLPAGAAVLARGFGLAFVDVMILTCEGRGGQFVERADGTLDYRPSGREPVLHVGSRRGVPYHAKLGYSLPTAGPVPPVHFTPAAIAAAAGSGGTAPFEQTLWPLIVKELAHAHYRELFAGHPDRTSCGWAEFAAELAGADVRSSRFQATAEAAVPKSEDRFDLSRMDRPFAGRTFTDRNGLEAAVVEYVDADLARRADSHFSADAAVFSALLTVVGVLAGAVVAGRISAEDRVRHVEGDFHGLFSFLASGPPPRRLRELLALHGAGLVRFVGPDMRVRVADGAFVASSPAAPGEIHADVLIDARLPRPDVRAATDPVVAGLLADRELAAEDLVSADGSSLGGGQLLADGRSRAIRADRTAHPRRFLLGPSVSGSAGATGFARPGFNGAGFRQNDQVARAILGLLDHRPDRGSPDAD